MPGIFFLADDLAPDGPAAVLTQIAPALADRFRVAIGVLGRPAGMIDEALVSADLPPVPLLVRGPFDLAGLRHVRKWVSAFGPTVIHAIGPKSAQAAAVLRLPSIGLKKRPGVIVSGLDGADDMLTDWAMRSADRVLVNTASEAEQSRHTDVSASRVIVIQPGVVSPTTSLDAAEFRKSLDIPATGRLITAVGRFGATSDLRSAVWAFDVVKYVTPDVYLVLVGDGPEQPRVERFARSLGFDDYRVRFAGEWCDRPSIFGLAEVVWVTHRRGGLTNVLQGMAAGRPVVAFRTPDLAGVIDDGKAGRLVPAGDRVRLAAVTAELLDRPAEAGAVGRAGQEFALSRYPAGRLADAYAAVYHELAIG